MEASIRELKGRLSHYLRRVAAGTEIIVTSRGRPIARLVAEAQSDHEPSSAEVRRRIASIPGVLLPTGNKPRGAEKPLTIRKGEKSLAQIVLENRR
jgi:prevent-host-death family protein